MLVLFQARPPEIRRIAAMGGTAHLYEEKDEGGRVLRTIATIAFRGRVPDDMEIEIIARLRGEP